ISYLQADHQKNRLRDHADRGGAGKRRRRAMTELSFIVPVYNRETHIEKFLEELLAINMPDMEVICVDDGSTDGTARLLDRTAEKRSKIKAYHIQNCGP